MKVFNQTECCPDEVIDRILTTYHASDGTWDVLIDFNGNVLEKEFD